MRKFSGSFAEYFEWIVDANVPDSFSLERVSVHLDGYLIGRSGVLTVLDLSNTDIIASNPSLQSNVLCV
jgi:hypothetical protein